MLYHTVQTVQHLQATINMQMAYIHPRGEKKHKRRLYILVWMASVASPHDCCAVRIIIKKGLPGVKMRQMHPACRLSGKPMLIVVAIERGQLKPACEDHVCRMLNSFFTVERLFNCGCIQKSNYWYSFYIFFNCGCTYRTEGHIAPVGLLVQNFAQIWCIHIKHVCVFIYHMNAYLTKKKKRSRAI